MPLSNNSVDALRQSLYNLGFLASALFATRFAYQWYTSEKAKKSLVDRTFWKVSILGNLIMACHYLIQVNFGLCLVQTLNGVFAWRNLQLMNSHKALCYRSRAALVLTICALCTGLFLLQSWLFIGELDWVRSPHSSRQAEPLSLYWHLLGMLGACTFSLRFWIQWWRAENRAIVELEVWFWILSLVGAGFLTVYSAILHDPVTFYASAAPSIGYIRNLMLVKRRLKETRI
jgi:lipid-A-disaccharide synthase-like uncharacterized protein